MFFLKKKFPLTKKNSKNIFPKKIFKKRTFLKNLSKNVLPQIFKKKMSSKIFQKQFSKRRVRPLVVTLSLQAGARMEQTNEI